MYTQCLNCWSILAIHAEAIREGRGKARCGHCLEEFDALETLTDTLAELLAETANRGTENRPVSNRACESEPKAFAHTSVQAHRDQGSGSPAGLLRSASDSDVPTRGEERRDDIGHLSDDSDDRLPETLLEPSPASSPSRSSSVHRMALGIGSLVLLALLAGQWIGISGAALGERYPAWLPVLEPLCQYGGCDVARPRDPTQIQLVSRDVRVHPDYEGALRITATMVNRLAHTQPYPRMQFTLFNVNGEAIVGRTFRPDEYLASEVDVTAGMPSQEPIQMVLDLLALEEAAVSFEFRFL